MAWYFDASALTKLAVAEPESEALKAVISARSWVITTSALSLVELRRAAKRRGAAELQAVNDLLPTIDWFDLTDPILTSAGELDPPLLRTLDAIHVASALSLGEACEGVITYDVRMQEAARAAGLLVAAPGQGDQS